jgi:hypothetical protein
MHFQYLIDQGKIDGPRLAKRKDIGSQYANGLLSPWKFNREQGGKNLKAPFAGATYGANAGASKENWAMSDGTQPMSTNREIKGLAESMYAMNLKTDNTDPGANADFYNTGYRNA